MLSENAGMEGSVIVSGVRRAQAEKNDKEIGYDVLNNQYINMVQKGIIDPVKVTRSALENAVSIAAMILTTEALVTDIPEPKAPPAPGGGMPEY